MSPAWEILLLTNAVLASGLIFLAGCFLVSWLICFLHLDIDRRSKPSRSRKPKKE